MLLRNGLECELCLSRLKKYYCSNVKIPISLSKYYSRKLLPTKHKLTVYPDKLKKTMVIYKSKVSSRTIHLVRNLIQKYPN